MITGRHYEDTLRTTLSFIKTVKSKSHVYSSDISLKCQNFKMWNKCSLQCANITREVIVEMEVNAHRLITTTYAKKESAEILSVEKDTQRYASIISEMESVSGKKNVCISTKDQIVIIK